MRAKGSREAELCHPPSQSIAGSERSSFRFCLSWEGYFDFPLENLDGLGDLGMSQ